MTFILAKKLNMTQVFTQEGRMIPVTVLEATDCKVTNIRSVEKDKYAAVQVATPRERREFRVGDTASFQVGQELRVESFSAGQQVKIKAVTKGRGFAGAMKRHGFHGAPASHGHDHPRAVGSIGSMFPQHTRKGVRMAGRMGNTNATFNSVVVHVDPDKRLLFIKGSVPGAFNGLVKVVAGDVEKPPVKLAGHIIEDEKKVPDKNTGEEKEESKDDVEANQTVTQTKSIKQSDEQGK